jgi:hypothetical protein
LYNAVRLQILARKYSVVGIRFGRPIDTSRSSYHNSLLSHSTPFAYLDQVLSVVFIRQHGDGSKQYGTFMPELVPNTISGLMV